MATRDLRKSILSERAELDVINFPILRHKARPLRRDRASSRRCTVYTQSRRFHCTCSSDEAPAARRAAAGVESNVKNLVKCLGDKSNMETMEKRQKCKVDR